MFMLGEASRMKLNFPLSLREEILSRFPICQTLFCSPPPSSPNLHHQDSDCFHLTRTFSLQTEETNHFLFVMKEQEKAG